MNYIMVIAGEPVYLYLKNDDTVKYYNNYLSLCTDNTEYIDVPEDPIVPLGHLSAHDNLYPAYMNSLYLTSNCLLDKGICCYHSLAIRANGKGILITADSGVGKTTQYKNLKKLYGDQIEIINGDKPFLKFDKTGDILIYSSPWRGKENYGSDITCSLNAIVFLRQAKQNKLDTVLPDKVAVTSLGQFLYYPVNTDVIRKVCELDRCLLNSTSLWLLENAGDLESSRMLYERVITNGEL